MPTTSMSPMSSYWWGLAVATSLVTVVTVTGNAAVLRALKTASPRLPTHYPLASLAAADLMLGVFVLPLAAARELFVFQPIWALCALWSTLDVLCCTASILSLCALGWERWSGISAPLARARRRRWARRLAAGLWPVAAAVALPTALVPSHHQPPTNEAVKACTVNTNIGYVVFSVCFSFYIPAVAMCVLYWRILSALVTSPGIRAHRGRSPCPAPRAQAKQITISIIEECKTAECHNSPFKNLRLTFTPDNLTRTQMSPAQKTNGCSTPQRPHLDLSPSNGFKASSVPSPLKIPVSPGGAIPRQGRATQTIMTLMAVFLICWTPFFVMLPIDSLCECLSDTTWQLCTWFGYVNSALDPLVYAAASPTVRRALQASFTHTGYKNYLTPPAKRRQAAAS